MYSVVCMLCMICVHFYVNACLDVLNRCTFASNRCTEYKMIYTMMGMDALDGYWMEHMLVLMVFWMGWGGFGMVFG